MKNYLKYALLVFCIKAQSVAFGYYANAGSYYAQPVASYQDYGWQDPYYLDGCSWSSNLSFSAEYLYWQVRTENLSYAVLSPTLPFPREFDSTVQRVRPHADSGCRLGIGYELPCFCGYDLSLQWTRFKTNASDSVSGSDVLPVLISLGGNPLVTNASASYDFKLNIVDLDIGRDFCVGRCFSLHPHAGFRGVWIDQDLDAIYSGGNVAPPIHSFDDLNFRGYGLRTGLDVQWGLCYGFSLISRTSVDLLWSKSKIEHTEFHPGPRASMRDHVHTINPVFELFLGLMWEHGFCSCSFPLSLQFHIGWEQQYIVNGLQFNQFSSSEPPRVTTHQLGGLGIGGLTTGVTLKF